MPISQSSNSRRIWQAKKCADIIRAVAYLKSISKTLGYGFADCFEVAYNEIKDRKGKWIDGTFVKEEDLKNEV